MATILKCKMCGGDIEVNADMSVGTCIYCGSTMTLPHIDSDKKARLFNMANQYRLNNEFDKAYEAYRDIVSEDEQESEAYWGMILSEYGVEYVEDPKTKHRIPTCHRTLSQSIKDTVNYEMALKYADVERKMMYRDEADIINSLQQKILSVSSKIEPYDVFICYKETDDETGERTQDSVIAQDIYNELEKQGLKTFFARISLESVLGQDYEPYIYAALHSAKVMLMVSTKQEHCNAVWVKNEWNRYIGFMEEDENKSIIPVYKDMSPYEFPYELTKYQAQDMSKIGAVQDLVTGVKKLCGRTVMQANNETINMLLKEKEEREEEKKHKNARIKRRKRILLISIIPVIIICFLLNEFVVRHNIYYKELIKQTYVINTTFKEQDIKEGNPDNVIKCYEKLNKNIVNKYDYSFDTKIKIADAYIVTNKIEKADEIFDQILQKELSDNEKAIVISRLYNTQQYSKVIDLYETIEDKNVRNGSARYYKGALKSKK